MLIVIFDDIIISFYNMTIHINMMIISYSIIYYRVNNRSKYNINI